MALHRGRRRHRGAHQMRATAGTLAAFEVAVARRCAALARLQPVGVHRQAHRATGLAPFEAGGAEHLIEPLALGLLLHETGTGNDQRQAHVRRDVPQVTCGLICVASSSTTASQCALASDCSVRQWLTACSHSTPFGANVRPFTYSIVFSSTATRPARAPASMAMLHTVMRPSTLKARIALPPNSMV